MLFSSEFSYSVTLHEARKYYIGKSVVLCQKTDTVRRVLDHGEKQGHSVCVEGSFSVALVPSES